MDDFDSDFAKFTKNGIRFTEKLPSESHGKVVKFNDIFGDLWDFLATNSAMA